MKRFLAMAAFISALSPVGLALAQSRPVVGVQVSPGGKADPNTHDFNLLLRKQMRQVHQDYTSGKLSKDQAQARLVSLKSARLKELEFFQQNGDKKLSDAQKSQLQQMLTQD